MLLRRFTDFILQSRLNALGTAFLCAFIPIIGSISILIALLVTLCKGTFEGALVVLAATLPYLLSGYVVPVGASETQLFSLSIAVVVASNFLAWVFAVLIRRYGNWSFTLEIAVLTGVLIIGSIHILYPDIQSWWETHLNTYLDKTVAIMNNVEATDALSTEVRAQMIAATKSYATGLVTASLLFNALLQLVLSRWWQAVMFNPGGLRKELTQIRLSYIIGVLFIAGIAGSYWGNATVLDIMPVFYAIFCLAGLSLVHSLLSEVKGSWLWLILIYLGSIWLIHISIAILSMLALLDVWMDFRKRIQLKR